jgi:uncharacterized membrane protein YtjA (UPF0391 family)
MPVLSALGDPFSYSTNGLRPRSRWNQRASGPVIDWERPRISGGLSMEDVMLYWALVFFVIAIIAAVFGFGGIASTAAGIAQILFFVFLVIFLISLVMGLAGRRRPPI